MDKKGQGDIGKLIGSIMGLFVFIIFGIAVVGIISNMFNTINQDQCKPIQEKSDQLQAQVNAAQLLINQTNILLEQCRFNYTNLANQTITRKDFEEVKGYFNLTYETVNTINKKIDNINRVYNLYNINIKNYSFGINIALTIEVLSLLLLKNEFIVYLIRKWKNRKKKEIQPKPETK